MRLHKEVIHTVSKGNSMTAFKTQSKFQDGPTILLGTKISKDLKGFLRTGLFAKLTSFTENILLSMAL